jgi:Tfp pilus assembly PilM family ATPase/Tfp pilus assembly protein PilN
VRKEPAPQRQAPPVIDIGQSSLKVRWGRRTLEVALEREPGGELTARARESAAAELRAFLGGSVRRPRQALCAVPARGVSLRRLELPPVSREEAERLLALQLEREFPLPPERLAWGYSLPASTNGTAPVLGPALEPATAPALLLALRRESLDEYQALLSAAGLRASFGLGILAASRLCPNGPGRSALLDVGRTHSELLLLDDGPASVRSLSWGGEEVSARIAELLAIGRDEAEAIKRRFTGRALAAGAAAGASEEERAVLEALREGATALARLVHEALASSASPAGADVPQRLFLVGGGSRLPGFLPELAERLGEGAVCERLESAEEPTVSAVIRGLIREAEAAEASPPIRFVLTESGPGRMAAQAAPAARRWLAAAIALALLSVLLRYGPPMARLRGLAKRLSQVQSLSAARPALDQELAFLQSVKASRAPYLEVLSALAGSSPPGTRLESFSMSRQGEVSVKGSLGSREEAGRLREKLLQSGWFSQVVMEEENPAKEKRLDFRLSAQARPDGPRPPAPAVPAPPAREVAAKPVSPPHLEEGAPPPVPSPVSPAVSTAGPER